MGVGQHGYYRIWKTRVPRAQLQDSFTWNSIDSSAMHDLDDLIGVVFEYLLLSTEEVVLGSVGGDDIVESQTVFIIQQDCWECFLPGGMRKANVNHLY